MKVAMVQVNLCLVFVCKFSLLGWDSKTRWHNFYSVFLNMELHNRGDATNSWLDNKLPLQVYSFLEYSLSTLKKQFKTTIFSLLQGKLNLGNCEPSSFGDVLDSLIFLCWWKSINQRKLKKRKKKSWLA